MSADLSNDALQFDTLFLNQKLSLMLLFRFVPRKFAGFLVLGQLFAQQGETFLKPGYLLIPFLKKVEKHDIIFIKVEK